MYNTTSFLLCAASNRFNQELPHCYSISMCLQINSDQLSCSCRQNVTVLDDNDTLMSQGNIYIYSVLSVGREALFVESLMHNLNVH